MAAWSLAHGSPTSSDAIGRIRSEMAGVLIEVFEADWRQRWLVERGVEITSEASRHLSDELKARHRKLNFVALPGDETEHHVQWAGNP